MFSLLDDPATHIVVVLLCFGILPVTETVKKQQIVKKNRMQSNVNHFNSFLLLETGQRQHMRNLIEMVPWEKYVRFDAKKKKVGTGLPITYPSNFSMSALFKPTQV